MRQRQRQRQCGFIRASIHQEERQGLVLVQYKDDDDGMRELGKELGSSDADRTLLNVANERAEALRTRGECGKVVDRCLKQLGKRNISEYKMSLTDSIKASYKLNHKNHGALWAVEMLPLTLLATLQK